MNFNLFKNKVTYKIIAENYIYIYINIYIIYNFQWLVYK